MNKYPITMKTIIPKLLIGIPFVFFIDMFYLVNRYPSNENDELTLKGYMFREPGFLLTTLLSFLIIALFIYLVVKRHKFYDNGDFFVVEKGLFFKKEIKILYKNINTIAVKRSLIDLILYTSKIEIDSGTTVNQMPEGKLPLNKEYALYLKEFLESKKLNHNIELQGPNNYEKTEEKSLNVIYKIQNKKLFWMGVLRPGFLISVLIIFVSLTSIGNIGYIYSEEVGENLTKEMISAFISLISLLLIIFLGFGISHIFKYYNYQLIDHGDYLEYEYGLFNKNNFKFRKDRINALYLKRSLLYRLFNKYSLEASIIGIGDNPSERNQRNQAESSFLIPYGNNEELLNVLNSINANQIYSNEFVKPTKHAKLNFIYLPLIIPTIILIMAIITTIVTPFKFYFILGNLFLLYILLIISLVLRLKYHGYNISNQILIRNGSFTIVKVLVNKTKIQTINYNQGPIKDLMKIGNINLRYKKLLGNINVNGYEHENFINIKNQVFNNKT